MYYLIQFAYWCQQLLVLTLGLEKPRKDYKELVAHHFVTLYMVGYVCLRLIYFSLTVSTGPATSWTWLTSAPLSTCLWISQMLSSLYVAFAFVRAMTKPNSSSPKSWITFNGTLPRFTPSCFSSACGRKHSKLQTPRLLTKWSDRYFRHYLNICILWSIVTELRHYVPSVLLFSRCAHAQLL